MEIATKEAKRPSRVGSLLEENSEKLLTCVHCGLCLPSCPTYRELGNENDSPRGRIYLMRSLAEGRIEASDSFMSHIDLCLGCRACETACPSGVPYGHLLEAARAEVAQVKEQGGSIKALSMRFVLNQVFTRPGLLRASMAIARWVRDSGLAQLAFDSRLVSGRARFGLRLLLASRSPLSRGGGRLEPPAQKTAAGKAERRVALLRGCVMEGLFTAANRATERVLERNGSRVVDAADQVCCGALHAHAGQIETARELAKKNIEAFESSKCDWIIVNSAGCGAAMKEYKDLLAGDSGYAARAKLFSSKVKDISEFLSENGFEPPAGGVPRSIVYDAPCHLMHAQRIANAPVELMKAIPGAKLLPLNGYERCCGGAGIYNLQHPDLSADILATKIESIKASGADTVATGNPGCIMQIGGGLLGLKIDVVHPIELLDAAYLAGERGRKPRS